MKKITFSRQELINFANNNIGFYGLDVSRISCIFIDQVMQMEGERIINTHQILDEVKFLEGINKVTNTKASDQFKMKPLKGLMKKHFTDASFILKNLGAHFGYDYGGNKNLDTLIGEAFSRNKSGYVDDEFINHIAHEITIGAFKERASKRKLSGEWIVFQKYNGKNYYLTLAAHDEGDESIYRRVCDAYKFDFNFLLDST